MQANSSHVAPPVALTAFALSTHPVYNDTTGVYGGAIVSSIGTVVAALFGSLAQR